MSLSLVQSRALLGLEAAKVTVEVHLANGLPSFTLVGLADVEVKEARDDWENISCPNSQREAFFKKNSVLVVANATFHGLRQGSKKITCRKAPSVPVKPPLVSVTMLLLLFKSRQIISVATSAGKQRAVSNAIFVVGDPFL